MIVPIHLAKFKQRVVKNYKLMNLTYIQYSCRDLTLQILQKIVVFKEKEKREREKKNKWLSIILQYINHNLKI